jgi:hypothetical protein
VTIAAMAEASSHPTWSAKDVPENEKVTHSDENEVFVPEAGPRPPSAPAGMSPFSAIFKYANYTALFYF